MYHLAGEPRHGFIRVDIRTSDIQHLPQRESSLSRRHGRLLIADSFHAVVAFNFIMSFNGTSMPFTRLGLSEIGINATKKRHVTNIVKKENNEDTRDGSII